MSRVISAKIPEELKKKADKYGVKIGPLLRDALEARVNAIESRMLSTNLDEIGNKIGPKLRKQDIVKAIRLSRDER